MNIKDLLLQAPDGQIAHALFSLIEEWSDPPTALQILKVLDHAVYSGGASTLGMTVLTIEYDSALKRERKSGDDIVNLATWRAEL